MARRRSRNAEGSTLTYIGINTRKYASLRQMWLPSFFSSQCFIPEKCLHISRVFYFTVHFVQVKEMRSIDNLFIVADVQTVSFPGTDKEADLELFKDVVHKHMSLNKSLDIWKRATCFMGQLYPTLEEYNSSKEQAPAIKEKEKESKDNKARKRGVDPSESMEGDILRYRVTGDRTGTHTFESTDVACVIGGELQTKYHWMVDLSKYHLEIICKLTERTREIEIAPEI